MPIPSKSKPAKISSEEWMNLSSPLRGLLEGKRLQTNITLIRYVTDQAGDIVFGPANVPHGYQNLGPGRLDSLDIHLSPEWIQYNLASAWDSSSILISAQSKLEKPHS